MCVRPDGKFVDINGVHAPGEVTGLEGWDHIPVDEDLWQYVLNWTRGQKPDLEAARPYVAALLAQLDGPADTGQGDDEDGEDGDAAGAPAGNPTGPTFPGVLLECEHVAVSDEGRFDLTTAEGYSYWLAPISYAPDAWNAGHAGSSGFWYGDDRTLDKALEWVRFESVNRARFTQLWQTYRHLLDEPVAFRAEVQARELQPDVQLVTRFGRSGLIAMSRWGWDRVSGGEYDGSTPETWRRKNPEHRLYTLQWGVTHLGLNAVGNDRLTVTGICTDDKQVCATSTPYVGKCLPRHGTRFWVDVTDEDGRHAGRIVICGKHMYYRLVQDFETRSRELASLAYDVADGGPSKGYWNGWNGWQDRGEDLTTELLTAAVNAGEIAPWPAEALRKQILAEASERGEDRAARAARKTAREAGLTKKTEQDAAAAAAVAAHQTRHHPALPDTAGLALAA